MYSYQEHTKIYERIEKRICMYEFICVYIYIYTRTRGKSVTPIEKRCAVTLMITARHTFVLIKKSLI